MHQALPALAVPSAKTAPDPCGFRNAVWSSAQEASRFIDAVQAGEADVYTAGMASNYLIFKMRGIAADYGRPAGSKQFGDDEATMFGELGTAIQDHERGKRVWQVMLSARRHQAQAWRILSGVCHGGGKSRTWLGWLNVYGDAVQTLPRFHATTPWKLKWQFSCGHQTGTFIAHVMGMHGRMLLHGINQHDVVGAGSDSYSQTGKYRVRVISDCAWKVNVRPQAAD